MSGHPPLTQRRIFWFWVPLAAMWLIMSAEQPAITAVVSRLPDATRNLAAFGLTFSLALIVESPVIMLLTASTALATDRQSFKRLLSFTHLLAIVMTLFHLLLALTPLYGFVIRRMIGAPEVVVETSRMAFLLMTPWTAMIAYRRLMEGLMIRYGQPQRVTQVIVARLASTVAVLVGGLWLGRWEGASVGGAALSVGVTVGALSAWWLSGPVRHQGLQPLAPGSPPLTWGRLSAFYLPLALSTLITMIAQPILAFGLSRAAHPLESLAIWPVIMSLLFIGRSSSIAYQEVVVALLREPGAPAQLRRFAFGLAAASTLAFGLLALTPGASLWYRYISGLTPELIEMARLPTMLVALVPGLNALISWQRALLIGERRTGPISIAVGLNLATMAGVMLLIGVWPTIPGAMLASTALATSLVVELIFLAWQLRPAPLVPQPETVAGD